DYHQYQQTPHPTHKTTPQARASTRRRQMLTPKLLTQSQTNTRAARIVTKSFPALTYVIGRLGLGPDDVLIEEASDGAILFRLPVAAATALEDFFELRRALGHKTDAAREIGRASCRERA